MFKKSKRKKKENIAEERMKKGNQSEKSYLMPQITDFLFLQNYTLLICLLNSNNYNNKSNWAKKNR